MKQQRSAQWVIGLLLALFAGDALAAVVNVQGPDEIIDEVRTRLTEQTSGIEFRTDGAPAQLKIAVGARAFRDALATAAVPVVGIALTRDSYRAALRELDAPGRVSHTAVYWDPDPVQQLQLARVVLPAARRVGIFATEDSSLLAALRAECARLGLTPVIKPAPAAGQSLPRRLGDLFDETDFLLGIDGGEVFQPEHAKTVLMTAYRHGKPVIGPSSAWVQAGSIASLGAGMPETLAMLAEWLPQLLNAKIMPPPRYPARYWVSTNPQVARALSIDLPPPAKLPAPLLNAGGVP